VACIDTRRAPPMSPPVVVDRFVGLRALSPITRRDYLDRGGVLTYRAGDVGVRRRRGPEGARAPYSLVSPGPAVDQQQLAGHEPGFGRREVHDRRGDVLG